MCISLCAYANTWEHMCLQVDMYMCLWVVYVLCACAYVYVWLYEYSGMNVTLLPQSICTDDDLCADNLEMPMH